MENCGTNGRGFRIEPGLAGLTEEQLLVARSEGAKQGISLRESILRLGLVNEAELLRAVAERSGLEFVNISATDISCDALRAITANVASHYNIIPLGITGNILRIATCDPFNESLKNEIELILGNSHSVEFALTPSELIRKAIRVAYGVGAATVEQMVTAEQLDTATAQKKDLIDESKAREASVIKLVNQVLADAITAGATDIHIEPYEDVLRVRYRIDGVLHDAGVPGTVRFFREGITSRIKIISGLDIAEKRLPQDSRAQVSVLNHKFDLRISILPTRYGEVYDSQTSFQ